MYTFVQIVCDIPRYNCIKIPRIRTYVLFQILVSIQDTHVDTGYLGYGIWIPDVIVIRISFYLFFTMTQKGIHSDNSYNFMTSAATKSGLMRVYKLSSPTDSAISQVSENNTHNNAEVESELCW